MKIFITGGLGFVGRQLSQALLEDGHQVTGVGRSANPTKMIEHSSFSYLVADTTEAGGWQERVADYDIVINLAGKSIFTLWTKRVKKEIYDSRILTTRNLADSLNGASHTIFFSTSAVGYYGDRGEDILSEEEPVGNDFLAGVCADWEKEALRARQEQVRVVINRFGIVLDRGGGAMASMVPAFKFFLGGRLGSGRQWFPWIHMGDLIGAYRFAIAQTDLTGPVNWCAAHPVRNQQLTKSLARKLNRPAIFPAPAPLVRNISGRIR